MKGSYGRYALVGALLCAMLAAWFNVRFLALREERVEVLTLVREVQPYTEIPADAVRLTALPKEAVPVDSITDLAELQGSYTRALLIPGTPLRRAHLVPAGGSNLAAKLAVEQAHDTRAMALQVNEATGVAGTLREGDPVDILVAIHAEPDSSQEKGRMAEGTLSRVIAQRIPVLYVQRTEVGGPATVVLQVSPATAEEIAFAQANGMIWLLTSPYGGEGRPVETTGVDRKVFFERYGTMNGEATLPSAQSTTAATTPTGPSQAAPPGSILGGS